MASKHPLSVWLSEIFFEDNRTLRRRASRFGLVGKIASTFPRGAALLFSNFAASYPKRKASAPPMPESVAEREVGIDEWPRHPGTGGERGLPLSDSCVLRFSAGSSLAAVHDLVFAMREIHRVCVDGAEVSIGTTALDELARDPTLVRPVTRDTLAFFSDPAPKARALGFDGMFRLDGSALRVVKSGTPSRPARIDIGCGTTPREGYDGIDHLPLPGVAIVRDVERHGLPFSDSVITHVYTAHFLEHVRDLVFVMNEIHRVCCHNAIVEISVPTLLGPYAAADPTHVRLFNARTFSYFEAGEEPYAGITKGFEILEQHVGLSLSVKLRVLKE